LEIHRLSSVGLQGRIEGVRMSARRDMIDRFYRMDGFPVVKVSASLSRSFEKVGYKVPW